MRARIAKSFFVPRGGYCHTFDGPKLSGNAVVNRGSEKAKLKLGFRPN